MPISLCIKTTFSGSTTFSESESLAEEFVVAVGTIGHATMLCIPAVRRRPTSVHRNAVALSETQIITAMLVQKFRPHLMPEDRLYRRVADH